MPTGKRKIDAVDEDSGSFVINKRRLTEVASPIVNPLADSFAIRRSIQGVERNRLHKRQPTMMKAPVIVESQLWVGHENRYNIQKLGRGNDHQVWSFTDDTTIEIPTNKGIQRLDPSRIVLKTPRSDGAAGKKLKEKIGVDQRAFDSLDRNFALFNRPAPKVNKLVSANDWTDPAFPNNGADIFEKCDKIDQSNPEAVAAFWEFAKEICHLAIQYATAEDESTNQGIRNLWVTLGRITSC